MLSKQVAVEKLEFSWKKQDGITPFINNLTVSFKCGQPNFLCGPSGAGKSTLGQLIAGLLLPDQGKIIYEGKSASELLLQIAYVFQFPETLFFEDSLDSEINEQTESDRGKFAFYAERVGLNFKHQESKSPYQLSGGQARLFALILQLSRETDILIVDEPTAGLDWKYSSKVSSLLKEWCKQDKILIVITHDLELMEQLRGYSYCFDKGKLMWQGLTADLINQSDLLEKLKLSIK